MRLIFDTLFTTLFWGRLPSWPGQVVGTLVVKFIKTVFSDETCEWVSFYYRKKYCYARWSAYYSPNILQRNNTVFLEQFSFLKTSRNIKILADIFSYNLYIFLNFKMWSRIRELKWKWCFLPVTSRTSTANPLQPIITVPDMSSRHCYNA